MANTKTSFFTNIAYNVRIAPFFTTNTIQTGGAFGHLLAFPGTGFSNNAINLTDFSCSLGLINCKVISNPQGSITIQLPPYQAGYETSGLLPKDPKDTLAQQNPYLGSY